MHDPSYAPRRGFLSVPVFAQPCSATADQRRRGAKLTLATESTVMRTSTIVETTGLIAIGVVMLVRTDLTPAVGIAFLALGLLSTAYWFLKRHRG